MPIFVIFAQNMTNMNYIDKAVELKKSGQCNCAQSVACAFAPVTGLDVDTIAAATAAYGTGMGCTRATCGALLGAGMILGLLERDRNRARMAAKGLMEKFQEGNGATVCRDLKGIDTGVVLRACNDCVADAAEFLQQYINDKNS